MDDAKSIAENGYLSASAVRLYGQIAQSGVVDPERGPELEQLLEWGLVTVQDGVLVASEPRDAMRKRAMEQVAVLQEQAARIAAVPAVLDDLVTGFQRGRTRHAGCEYLPERETVNARIADVVAAAKDEILAAQPGGPRTRELMEIAIRRDAAALRRGVSMRTLYRDSVRHHPVTREWAQIMSAQGGVYRTLAGPFQRCILVDGKTAFIEDLVVGASENAGWVVTDRAMVAFITASFEEWWRRAEPWRGYMRDACEPDGVRTTRLQREILRDTVTRATQTATATRLGISVRSLQRELTVLREMWGVETLTELAYQWALSPDRLVDDQAVDVVTGEVPVLV